MTSTSIVFFQSIVVCKQLGFKGATTVKNESSFGTVGTGFAYDDVNCIGIETELDKCSHLNKHNCGESEGAGVICEI